MKYTYLTRIIGGAVLFTLMSSVSYADVPEVNKLPSPASVVVSTQQGQTKVNINTADITALKTLPGIGKVKAMAVMNYRQKNGSFKNIQDLKKIKGFSPLLVNQLKDKISI